MEKDKFPAEKVLYEFCCGHEDAYKFCIAFYAWAHTFDDLIDGDKPVDPLSAIKVTLNLIVELTNNPFYTANKDGILALMAVGSVAWADSMDWAGSPDPIKQRDSEVIKSIYYEVFNYVALIVGGFDHVRNITAKYRNYDHEEQHKEAQQ